MLHCIGLHTTILVSPAVEGRLAYAELPCELWDRNSGGELLVRLAQLADYLLWGVCLFIIESPPFSARFGLSDSHSSWISFRALPRFRCSNTAIRRLPGRVDAVDQSS